MTDQQKKDVEATAGCFFSPEETLIICELRAAMLKDTDFKLAYKKGRLIKEAAIRKSIIELAVSGSSPAQVLAIQILNKSKLDMIET